MRPRLPLLPILHKNPRAVDSGRQPKHHINQINPNRILHPLNSLIAIRLLPNKQLPKDPKQDYPKKPEKRIPGEKHPGFEDGDQEDERGDAGKGADDDGVDPVAVCGDVGFGGFAEVVGVEADDREAHDELQDADNEADYRAEEKVL